MNQKAKKSYPHFRTLDKIMIWQSRCSLLHSVYWNYFYCCFTNLSVSVMWKHGIPGVTYQDKTSINWNMNCTCSDNQDSMQPQGKVTEVFMLINLMDRDFMCGQKNHHFFQVVQTCHTHTAVHKQLDCKLASPYIFQALLWCKINAR